MNQDKQAEALRLAEHLEKFRSFPDDLAAAAELRRQNARIAELEASQAQRVALSRTEVDECVPDEGLDKLPNGRLGVTQEWIYEFAKSIKSRFTITQEKNT